MRKQLQALRAAHKSTHPFYWAALIASGDWR
jgi:CHAT domain-containing protein